MSKVKVTLTKSLIGSKPNQKSTAESLGLRKIGDSFIDPVDLPTLRTMFGGGACK